MVLNIRDPEAWERAIKMLARYMGGKFVEHEQSSAAQDQSRLAFGMHYVRVLTVRDGHYRSLTWRPR